MDIPWNTIITTAGTLGLGVILKGVIDKVFPSKKERAETRKTDAETHKINNEGIKSQLEFNEEIKAIVKAETEKYRDLIIHREFEHRVQIEMWTGKLNEAHTSIEKYVLRLQEQYGKTGDLEERIYELESILRSNGLLTDKNEQ